MTLALFHKRRRAAAFSPLSLSPAAWYKADAGCYTDAACSFVAASSQYLSKSSPTFAPTTKMTIRLSWKPTTIGGDYSLVDRLGAGINDGFILWCRTGGNIDLTEYGTSGSVSGNTALVSGNQYEIVVVYDGTQSAGSRGKIFINGVEDTYATNTLPAALTASTADLKVGWSVSAYFANGVIGRVGLSSLALSGAALTAAHTSTFYADMTTARKADWFSFYNLCEASSTRVDSTGLNDLTPTNTPGVAQGPGEGLATNNSPVKRWEDQSGNAKHLTQATMSKQPLWVAVGQNGLPVVAADGVNDYMDCAVALSSAAVYVLGVYSLPTSNTVFMDGLSVGERLYIGFFVDAPNEFGILSGGTGFDEPYTVSATYHLWDAKFSGAASSVLKDGAAFAAGTTVTDPAIAGLRLGADYTPSNYMATGVGELSICAAIPTASLLTSMRAYLKARWGTP